MIAGDPTRPRDDLAAPAFEDLLDRARLGEGGALAELWHRYAPALARFARAASAEDPDAVVNDAFLGAFGGLARFRGDEAGFRALLYTIARRRLVDEARSRARRVPTTEYAAADAPAVPSVEVELFGVPTGGPPVLDLVRSLPPDQRDVVLLRLVADLPIGQVADVLGKRPGAVKSLQRRALDALRRKLAADPGPTDHVPSPPAPRRRP